MQKRKHMKPILGVNDLQSQRPEIAARLDVERSGLTAQEVTYGARIELWWHCLKEEHSFPATPNKMADGAYGCGYCSSHRVLAGFNDLATLKSELVAAEWDFERNTIAPSELTADSHQKVWWLCSKYKHSSLRSPNVRGGCTYCWNQQLLRGFNDLQTCNSKLAASWHPTKNGDLSPSDILKGSGKRVWWLCERGHALFTSVKQRSTRGCRNCIHKTSKAEVAIARKLEKAGIEVVGSSRSLLDGKEIDIYLPEHQVGVEFNGTWWHSEERGTPRDKHHQKWSVAKERGIDLIFIEEIEYEDCPEIVDQLIQLLLSNVKPAGFDPSNPVRNGSLSELFALRNGYKAIATLPVIPRFFNLNKRVELASANELPEGKKLATIWGAGSSIMTRIQDGF